MRMNVFTQSDSNVLKQRVVGLWDGLASYAKGDVLHGLGWNDVDQVRGPGGRHSWVFAQEPEEGDLHGALVGVEDCCVFC